MNINASFDGKNQSKYKGGILTGKTNPKYKKEFEWIGAHNKIGVYPDIRMASPWSFKNLNGMIIVVDIVFILPLMLMSKKLVLIKVKLQSGNIQIPRLICSFTPK